MAVDTNSTQSFRFMDLPRDIRNDIYALLLCLFEPPPHPLESEMRRVNVLVGLEQLGQVHREDCDVMAKTNRYANLSDPLSLMLLTRDLENFRIATASLQYVCPEFCTSGAIEIHMAPILRTHLRPRHKPNLANFFSGNIPRALPPCAVSGASTVETNGPISTELAATVKHEVTFNSYQDPNDTARILTDKNQLGSKNYRNSDLMQACSLWSKAIHTIHRTRHDTSWEKLMDRGSDAFIGNMEELQCKLDLNIMQVGVLLQHDSDARPDKINRQMVKYGLNKGMVSMKGLFWLDEYT
ncbi:hypothetical protein HRS9139_08387 [Pyrenophora teres f. teres]|nr:hypothetical protein HRS9139_08387 [Pyrenophora teres f. teres]